MEEKELVKPELRRVSTQALIDRAIQPENIISEKEAQITELSIKLQMMERKLTEVSEDREKVLHESKTTRNLLEVEKKKVLEDNNRIKEDNIRMQEDRERMNMDIEKLLKKTKELEELKSSSNEKAEKN